MKTKRLGDSDLEITPLGIGTYALGGANWKFAWGPQDDQDSIATLRHAVSSGINWIDTAPVYGLGHAEEMVAKAIAGLPKRPLVFTKCSMVWDESGAISNVLKRDSLRREVEGSLKRLRVDVIDLYQIHWPRTPADLEEAWETLAKLKDEGKVRYIGVSNFDEGHLERVRKIAPVTSLQPPYSMLNRSIEPAILPYAREHGIGVIAYATMQNGLLSGKMTRERVAALPENDWRRGSDYFKEPQLSKNLAVAATLAEVGRELGGSRPFTVSEVAIAWALHQPGVTGAIVGARRVDHVDAFLRAPEVTLGERAKSRIDAACQ
ncbi:MAG TPA: aldo/keto reductase [Polyangiaceae bacterium]|nr:aldo/keto reductase [Polyangiaceae bacterium]